MWCVTMSGVTVSEAGGVDRIRALSKVSVSHIILLQVQRENQILMYTNDEILDL